MKFARRQIVKNLDKIPRIRFEDEGQNSLTSFAGLVVFQALFQRLKLLTRLHSCFGKLRDSATYQPHRVVLWLIVHLILGFRRLRDRDYYADDPMVCRVLGLTRLPDTATISRTLADLDESSVEQVAGLSRELVLNRLKHEQLSRLTLDFDGSVQSTKRHAEGTAVGFNKRKKGQRSYYPLFCTVAQTGQFFDRLHRPGNVHDSNGAIDFISQCVTEARQVLPKAIIEARLDSAFFSETLLGHLDDDGVLFTTSVPFERFPELKGIVENRKRWKPLDETWSYFECDWRPKCWGRRFRILCLRQRKATPVKGPLQLDLFEPRSHDYDYSVIVTNQSMNADRVMQFHHGRGSQEGLFAEAKSHCQMEYIPVRSVRGNQMYCLAAMMAHNLTRELQMEVNARDRGTTAKRAALWIFETLQTIRGRLIRRAGRLIRPQRNLTMVLGHNELVERDLKRYLKAA